MAHLGLVAATLAAMLSVVVLSDAASTVDRQQWGSGSFGATDEPKTVAKREAKAEAKAMAEGIGSQTGMLGGAAEAAKGGVDATKTGIQTAVEMGKTAAAGGIQAAEKVQG